MTTKKDLAALRLLEDANRSSLLELIEQHPNINRQELSSLAQRDKVEIAADVQLLVVAGLMTNHGSGDGAQYNLTPYGHKVLSALRTGDVNCLGE